MSELVYTVDASGRVYKNGVLDEYETEMRNGPPAAGVFEEESPEQTVMDVAVEQIRPTWKELASSAAEAAKTLMTQGAKTVSEEEKTARLGFCSHCKHLSREKRCLHVRLADGTVERGCGCYMPVKAWLKSMKCPTGRW